MPKLGADYDNAQESTGKEFNAMEPGAYHCLVTAVRTEGKDAKGNKWTSAEKEYVKVILEIERGEHAGKFSDKYWEGEDKDWGHTLYMSWKPRAFGLLKHTLAAFEEANPGFDARAAFEADKWDMFVGKRVMVHWNAQEYEGNDGRIKLRVRPDRAIKEDDNLTPKVEKLDGSTVNFADWAEPKNRPGEVVESNMYDDVPF